MWTQLNIGKLYKYIHMAVPRELNHPHSYSDGDWPSLDHNTEPCHDLCPDTNFHLFPARKPPERIPLYG
jgi:hypothetical protein